MAEYLYFDFDSLPPAEALLNKGVVLSPNFLVREILPRAHRQIVDTPGPHQQYRQNLVSDWIDWWQIHLSRLSSVADELIANDRLVRFSQVPPLIDQANQSGFYTGALNGATFEGTPGHRSSWRWIHDHTALSVVCFEPDAYFDSMPSRRRPFFPLSIRLSLCTLFADTPHNLVTVLPGRDPAVPESTHYQNVFDQTRAIVSFATQGDRHLYQKISRGFAADFCVIPLDPSASTSGHVEKLASRYHRDDSDDRYLESWKDSLLLPGQMQSHSYYEK